MCWWLSWDKRCWAAAAAAACTLPSSEKIVLNMIMMIILKQDLCGEKWGAHEGEIRREVGSGRIGVVQGWISLHGSSPPGSSPLQFLPAAPVAVLGELCLPPIPPPTRIPSFAGFPLGFGSYPESRVPSEVRGWGPISGMVHPPGSRASYPGSAPINKDVSLLSRIWGPI